MELKLETKADFIVAFKQVDDYIKQLEARLESRIEVLESSQPSYKQDPILKMPQNMKNAFLKARSEFLPLTKTGVSKKDGKTFPKFDDYKEATNKAFANNGIFINFIENKEAMKLATIISVNREEYTIESDIKPANIEDPAMALKFGFLNAKTNTYKALSQLK